MEAGAAANTPLLPCLKASRLISARFSDVGELVPTRSKGQRGACVEEGAAGRQSRWGVCLQSRSPTTTFSVPSVLISSHRGSFRIHKNWIMGAMKVEKWKGSMNNIQWEDASGPALSLCEVWTSWEEETFIFFFLATKFSNVRSSPIHINLIQFNSLLYFIVPFTIKIVSRWLKEAETKSLNPQISIVGRKNFLLTGDRTEKVKVERNKERERERQTKKANIG